MTSNMPATESHAKQAWEAYLAQELHSIQPILETLGFALDKAQVHTGGERYLTHTRDVGGGGKKLVLTGTRIQDGARVIIKVSSEPLGIQEIERERECRSVLTHLTFALRVFKTPQEIYYSRHGAHVISITEYIEQERPFMEHAQSEQFFLALRAFETQEGVHATTYKHASIIKNSFGMVHADWYLAQFDGFKKRTLEALPDNTTGKELFQQAAAFLKTHRTLIERYCGFLTHADFVPNNLRVAGKEIYLLDYASIHFGNKYESWARFLNFMIHHNTELGYALATYVRENRSSEEYACLRLMRVYKIGFLLAFYAEALHKTSGDLHTLTKYRLTFWSEAMQAMLEDRPVSMEIIEWYKEELVRLRSEEEKARQREILGGQ